MPNVDYPFLEIVFTRKDPRTVWLLCLPAMIWAIWKECNRQVFENLSGDPFSIWESFLFLIVGWVKKVNSFSNYSFECIQCDLRRLFSRERLFSRLMKYLFAHQKKKKKKRKSDGFGYTMQVNYIKLAR